MVLAVAGVIGAAIAIFFFTMKTAISVAFGSMIWIPVDANDPSIPRSLALALRATPPAAEPGPMKWVTLAPGFEVGELPVRASTIEVDRILLARVDPARYRFAVRNAPAGDKNIDIWMRDLCPVLVMNGSYYARSGLPDTPVLSAGHFLGPAKYTARQGAFVSSRRAAAIVDLAKEDWHDAFRGADDAMVSYPLLVSADGTSRTPHGSHWLANRSFLGEDHSGRIIFGTTKQAFFSLDRLADFLKRAPLDLKYALNVDGGPVACQAISLNGFKRRTCGRWEVQVENGKAKMLPTWPFSVPAMPMAVAVLRESSKPATCSW